MREVSLSVEDIRARAETDLDFFSALLVPDIATVNYPKYYHWLWKLLTELDMDLEKVFRFALGLPRNHAKTMFTKLLICHLYLYKKAQFVLLVCSIEPLAQNMLEDIDGILAQDIVCQVWGDWKLSLTRDTMGLKRGKFLGKNIVLACKGAGSSLRGLNVENIRPDVIIMDDMQTKECADNETENQNLLVWLFATLLKARNQKKALLLYVGNLYSEECILYKLKLHEQWQTFITGAILPDWTPLWPELFTLEQIISDYKHDAAVGLGEIWFAEVMNIPVGGVSSLLPDGKLPDQALSEPITDKLASFLTIDPAGYRKNSDDNVIARHSVYSPKQYRLEELTFGRFTPGELVDKTIAIALQFDIRLICVETVGYQQALQWLFEQELQRMGLTGTIQIVELKPSGRHKLVRIQSHVSSLLEASYTMSPKAYTDWLFQALSFKTDRKDNRDDLLDASAYGLDVRSDYHPLLVSLYLRSSSTKPRARVMDNNSFLDV